MNKTLLILGAHFVDETVISEYKKMRNTPNVDAILAIDNNAYKCEFKSRIENKIFYGVSVKCFFFDSDLNAEMDLPCINFHGEKNFGRVMWANTDYRFYYVRKFFPDYDYYWHVDYDVFCNASTYEGFLKKFENNLADLIITHFRSEKKNGKWTWTHGLDWAYANQEIYGSLFGLERLSARAVDFLYNRRLAHKEIFHEDGDKNKWIFCELFTPTELMNNGFSCENLDEPNIKCTPYIYLNDERIFLTPNNKLYHPVKSVRNEISKLKTKIDELNLTQKKLFLTSLVNFLRVTVDIKNFPAYFNEQFNFVIFSIPDGGGGRQLRRLLHRADYRQRNLYRLALRRKIC